MSQSLSAVLDLLTYTGPNLAGGASFTTIKRQILEYASLNISFYSNETFDIKVYFSDDGTNFDVTTDFTYNPSTSNGSISTPCLGAWTQIKITNTSIFTTSSIRMYVYGSITNSVTTAVFQTGSGAPHVIVDSGDITIDNQGLSVVNPNPFQDSQLNFQNIYPQSRTTFTLNDPTDDILPFMKWAADDPTISYYATDINKIGLAGFNVSGAGDVGKIARFYSSCITPMIIDKNIIVDITCRFRDPSPNSNVYYSDEQVGMSPMQDNLVATWTGGFSIGKGAPVAWGSTYTKFRIGLGGSLYVTQNNFNIDTLDGNGPSGFTLDITKLNKYRITFNGGGTVQILFSVFNPSTQQYINFNKYTDDGTTISPSQVTGFGLTIDSVNQASSATPANAAGSDVASFATYIDSGSVIKPGYPISYGTTVSTATTETVIVVIDNSNVYKTKPRLIPAVLDEISLSSSSTTNSLTVRIYKNSIFTAIAPLDYINPSYSPLLYTPSATITASSGLLIAQYTLCPSSNITKDINGIIINPEENLVITGQLTGGSSSSATYCLRFSHYF